MNTPDDQPEPWPLPPPGGPVPPKKQTPSEQAAELERELGRATL